MRTQSHRLALRLGFAAVLASVAIPAAAHAQIELNDSNTSNAGVVVAVRPQYVNYVAQNGTAKPDALGDAQKASSQDTSGSAGDKKNGDASTSETGRLSPITMESVRAPLGAANIAVTDIGTRVLPEDEASKQSIGRMPLPGGQDRAFSGLTYRWQAANICHLPLYFEEPMLERHGQQCCPTWIQPAVSGSKFLSNLVLYPYKATLHPAFENRYTLGHFRPGSGAPCLRDSLPWSTDAALVQAGATTAVFVGLPW